MTAGPAFLGVVVPYDMALDHELWRWAPDNVSLLFTRTPFADLPVTVEMAELVSGVATVEACVRDLSSVGPAAYAYACTSGSFVRGLAGERALAAALAGAGRAPAVTASGALLLALRALGVSRVAIATPYDAAVTERLAMFLSEAGVAVTGEGHLGLRHRIWQVPYETTRDLIRRTDSPEAEAIVVSCTNLPTYGVIADLEAELGKPVVSANQATMWAAVRALGLRIVGPDQRLAETTLDRQES